MVKRRRILHTFIETALRMLVEAGFFLPAVNGLRKRLNKSKQYP